ncbi:hypothetical protein EHI8A_010060 [Entamoeba histolytica HM-1:IMSS-B]|uniref:Transmembrane protein n=8 Tax=Entamoeba TaxID=5758 RepID=C4M726_ENTH1|nr:hypothetical protein ENU1_056930 [Entamoeba nuttalli P19]XP_654329.1 hypothetical protein EHI_183470 [Entamoeba histolytica HM-1:IMSS]EMD49666.1 Hypothetical protein EHI5A_020090 [Entamoeba histolytica KU27]EMH75283.1 hypothetical protein EHI8A_010060 [Entamoeba histolytica HM-1:IMSS-B]EMS13547.1 hypothetical protein KM1_020550 [Entamoeba histolytica HM-3:IMSS]ENY66035.1 hypothetical protein EHI7A_008250 [Entamoeba histolytica HM-1:IMSS-A]GAT97318.1 hypothetical protein CL6EHI_183470 [Enta|eukprot:XP_008856253.1 hypothetical protein ENU1_056930 [Entamoeba nuttalli P19]
MYKREIMDGEQQTPSINNNTNNNEQSFSSGLGVTSTGIPVFVEAFLSSFFVLSSAILFFVEKTNVYCRSVALQGVIWFFVLFIAAFPFYLTCIAFGGFFEVVMMLYVLFYLIFKIFLIVIALLRARSEVFFAIPPFGHLINKYAATSD